MVDVVHADIGGKPTQDMRQVIVRTPAQRRLMKIPPLIMGPEGGFELVLDIKQPDADRGCEKRNRNVHQQEWASTNQPNHYRDKHRGCDIRRHCTGPGLRTAAHQSKRESLPQDEVIRWTNAK